MSIVTLAVASIVTPAAAPDDVILIELDGGTGVADDADEETEHDSGPPIDVTGIASDDTGSTSDTALVTDTCGATSDALLAVDDISVAATEVTWGKYSVTCDTWDETEVSFAIPALLFDACGTSSVIFKHGISTRATAPFSACDI